MNLLSLLFGKPVPTLNAVDLDEKLKNSKRSLVIDVRQPESAQIQSPNTMGK